VQEVEGVSGFVDVGVEEVAHRLRLVLVRRRRVDQVVEPAVVAENREPLSLGRLAGAAEPGRGVEHDAADRR
jgi:hypothetical protein